MLGLAVLFGQPHRQIDHRMRRLIEKEQLRRGQRQDERC